LQISLLFSNSFSKVKFKYSKHIYKQLKEFFKKDAMCKIKCTMSNKSNTQQTNTFSTKISKTTWIIKKFINKQNWEKEISPSKSSLKKFEFGQLLPRLQKNKGGKYQSKITRAGVGVGSNNVE